jgi:hypothetical protein
VRFVRAIDSEGIFTPKTAASSVVGLRKSRDMERGMRERYRLVGLKNSELLAGLSDLVRRSNELTGEVLAHLAELEERKLHLEFGFTSTFAYCVEALGMSEGAAGRRVTGARVCRRFPEHSRWSLGELHLSALCELGAYLNPENANELLEACRRKTRRQVEHLLAARFPRPDVREQIRRLPGRTGMLGAVNAGQMSSSQARPPEADEMRKVAGAQPEVTDQRREAASAEMAGIPAGRGHGTGGPPALSGARRRELEALSVDRFGVHFTAGVELRDLIERARAVASHRLPKGDLASLMKLALTTFVQQEEKRRFVVGVRPRNAAAVGKTRKAAVVWGTPRKVAAGAEIVAGVRSCLRTVDAAKRGPFSNSITLDLGQRWAPQAQITSGFVVALTTGGTLGTASAHCTLRAKSRRGGAEHGCE